MRLTTLFLFALVACGTPEAEPVTEASAEAPPAAVEKAAWTHYGDAFQTAESSSCDAIIADPDAKVDTVVRVTGRIDNVCQKAGCWMVIADSEGEYLRVSMKGHSFGVPTDTLTGEGTLADVEGTLIKKVLDEKTLAHLMSEAKGTPEEMEKQFAPKYEIVASAVSVRATQ